MGKETTPNKYPWMAHIRIRLNLQSDMYVRCGGSLIDNQHVMTAAHCIFDEFGILRTYESTEVYLGSHAISKDLQNKYNVSNFFYDKRFDITQRKLNFDFALLKLSEPVKFTGDIYPICIPDSNIKKYKSLIVAGWGKLSEIEGTPDKLNEVEVDYIDREKCNKMNYDFVLKVRGIVESYPGQYTSLISPIHESHLCAINTKTGGSSCIGDSGGPLMYKSSKNHRWYAVGLVSGGYSVCGNINIPTLYTIVAKYKKFIKNYATGSQICRL
ncbi:CUB and peptidase domain-containing protein 2-like isoform X2 [Panonychus citri]|nr:CUB and peptidase domain-containing protein 2-like isoform X2 [Panonychus citri]